MMKQVTLDELDEIGACRSAKEWFEDQTTSNILELYELLKEQNHLDWANWYITRIMSNEQRIRYAIFAAEQVLHIFEDMYPDDHRPRKAIEAAKYYLDYQNAADAAYAAGAAADARAARAAAYAAAAAAYAAADAAYAAADAAYAAADAADAAYAAGAAADARAARAAAYAAADAARAAAAAYDDADAAADAAYAAAAAAAAAYDDADAAADAAAAYKGMLISILDHGLELIGVKEARND